MSQRLLSGSALAQTIQVLSATFHFRGCLESLEVWLLEKNLLWSSVVSWSHLLVNFTMGSG